MATDTNQALECQNEVIIGLLARLAIGSERIYGIVTAKKQHPKHYVNAYNALDGSIGVVQAAKLAGVSKGSMSSTLKRWESSGHSL